MTLQIKNLHIEHDAKKILNGVNLEIKSGEIHALMGPNGSGKSTLSHVIMGDSRYKVTKGEILFNGKNITNLPVNERAKLGIFLSFQNPVEIEGISVFNFLRQAYNSLNKKHMTLMEFKKFLEEKAEELNIDKKFLSRYINKGFSGGEKKKMEILQLSVLNPNIAILDETDSGLDIDALKIIAQGINIFKKKHAKKTILIITHYKRILEYIKPDRVSVILKGKIVTEGSKELINNLEEKGYGEF